MRVSRFSGLRDVTNCEYAAKKKKIKVRLVALIRQHRHPLPYQTPVPQRLPRKHPRARQHQRAMARQHQRAKVRQRQRAMPRQNQRVLPRPVRIFDRKERLIDWIFIFQRFYYESDRCVTLLIFVF